MTSSTKIVLAVIGLVVGIMIAYYGFLMPGGEPEAPVIQDPAAAVWEEAQTPATAEPELSPPVERGPAPITMGQPGQNPDGPPTRDQASGAPTGATAGPPARSRSTRAATPPPLATRPGKTWTPPAGTVPADGGKETPITTPPASATDPAPGPAAMKSRTLPPAGAGQAAPAGTRTPSRTRPPANRTSQPATTPPATRRTEAPTYTPYTVRSGDTMSSIAEEWFGDEGKWDLIAKANPLVDPSRLQIGQRLRLPAKDTKRSPLSVRVGREAKTYVVRSGDTLSGIAKAHYGSEAFWESIFDANRKAIGRNPHDLRVGMKLVIPPAPR
jgi:nucleoid-associated protein YgaU